MPSWNIHMAQTERLLERPGAVAAAVRDADIFRFGNVLPDIFVGFMVPGAGLDSANHIPYRISHFTDPVAIPKPREWEFWDGFVAPVAARAAALAAGALTADPVDPARGGGAGTPRVPQPQVAQAIAEERGRKGVQGPAEHPAVFSSAAEAGLPEEPDAARDLLDLCLGAWAHLLADHIWNARVNEYLDLIGGKPGEEFRIKKQGDFDAFGRTLALPPAAVPAETPALVRAAAAFPQYAVEEPFVHDSLVVMFDIARSNGGRPEHLPYRLLTDEFFDTVFNEVLDTTERLLEERLEGGASAAPLVLEPPLEQLLDDASPRS